MLDPEVCTQCPENKSGYHSKMIGRILCQIPDSSATSLIDYRKGQPPIWCPRKLEHGMFEVLRSAPTGFT